MKIGNRNFDVENECYVMGILNVTPDSFSDGGRWNEPGRAKEHAAQMIEEGASIIDIGGESTRPGHVQISTQEEIERVVPMIRMVKENFDIPVSIDSYKSDVVEAALKAGADMVNDIWGFQYDKRVAELTAAYQVPCCIMHNRQEPAGENFLTQVILMSPFFPSGTPKSRTASYSSPTLVTVALLPGARVSVLPTFIVEAEPRNGTP